METTISNFRTSFYIPEIQKLEFHIPHVQIIGMNYCSDSCQTAFKLRELFQDMFCCRDYSKEVVASFSHQIQSEYYVGNISVSIEGIALENLRALPQIAIKSSTKPCPRHALIHFFVR